MDSGPIEMPLKDAFGMDVDYAMLVKMYSDSSQPTRGTAPEKL